MSPIENENPLRENSIQENTNLTQSPYKYRPKQLFGVQLEVTSLLLEGERRKLAVLQKELQIALEDNNSIKKVKQQQKQELLKAILRIQTQYDILDKEYQQHAIGVLRSSNTRGFGKVRLYTIKLKYCFFKVDLSF